MPCTENLILYLFVHESMNKFAPQKCKSTKLQNSFEFSIPGIYNFRTYLAGRSALLALSLSIIYHYREFPLRSSSYFSFSPHFSFMPLPVECSNISCRDFMLRCCSFHHRCFVLFIMSQHLNEECKIKQPLHNFWSL